MKLTDPQARALLACVRWAEDARRAGRGNGPPGRRERLVGRAPGRADGPAAWWTWAWRAARRPRRFDGWESVWIITPAGRKALAAWKDGR